MPNIGSLTTVRSWRQGRLVEADVRADGLPAAAADPSTLTWIDLLDPTPQDLAVLADDLDLGATALEDVLGPHERPKVTRHPGHLFFVTYATRLDARDPDDPTKGSLRASRISGFVLPNALITIRLDDGLRAQDIERGLTDDADLLALGVGALVHGLLDVVVDGYFETIQRLDDAIEGLEDVLFEERSLGRPFLREVFGLRKDLVALRRVVLPMRDVVDSLLRHRTAERGALDTWYDDLYDHVLRAAEWTESLRDMVTTVFETNLSLQDSRLNGIMRQLAAWAAIIAVPTAITGWFGQNVPYAGFGTAAGVWASTVLIAACSVVLYVVFRRRDWL